MKIAKSEYFLLKYMGRNWKDALDHSLALAPGASTQLAGERAVGASTYTLQFVFP